MTSLYRVLADGLISAAEMQRHSGASRHLRDAAASLLDADMALEREGVHPSPFPTEQRANG